MLIVCRNNQSMAVRGLAYWNGNFTFQEPPTFLQPVREQVCHELEANRSIRCAFVEASGGVAYHSPSSQSSAHVDVCVVW